jgi:hypothetical protein
MSRRGELTLVAVSLAAFVVVAVAGLHQTSEEGEDPRLSIYSAAPAGAKGFAEALRRLGVAVQARRYALFDLGEDTTRPDPRRVFAFLDIRPPTAPEIAAVQQYVARGGRIFVAGYTDIERCFGYRSRRAGAQPSSTDSIALALPAARWRVPRAQRVLWRVPPESLGAARGTAGGEDEAEACAVLPPATVDTLVHTTDGRPIALRLRFRRAGEATLLADPRYLRNRTLKESDAGLVVLPWLLDGRTRWVTVDEYHHGYGAATGLLLAQFAAAWRWLTSNPAGWAMLQLLGVGLVAVAVAAVRFGPPRRAIETRRRSPLEHLDALAAGLEGAVGVDTAVDLIVAGLRRRLGRSGILRADEQRTWLVALELALPTVAGRDAVRRLQRVVTQPGGPERALAAAQAAEDVWEQLRPPTTRAAS